MTPQRVTKQQDNTYRWTCRIDTGYHKEQTKSGYWAVAIIVAFVILMGLFLSAQNHSWSTLWIPCLIAGVILLITLPLLHMSSNATDVMEEYWMTNNYVKAGYGKSAVFTNFDKTGALNVYPGYLELVRKGKTRRIYVPAEDIAFVEQFISQRLPQNASIKKMS